MTGVSAVSINDDLTSCQTAVALRAAYYESACRIDVDLCILVHKVSRNYRTDNHVLDVLAKLLQSNISRVL